MEIKARAEVGYKPSDTFRWGVYGEGGTEGYGGGLFGELRF